MSWNDVFTFQDQVGFSKSLVRITSIQEERLLGGKVATGVNSGGSITQSSFRIQDNGQDPVLYQD